MIAIASLQSRLDNLLEKQAALENAKSLVMMNLKVGRITHDQANAEIAKVTAERNVNDAVLASTESILAEFTNTLPVELKVADIADIVCLYDALFRQKSISGNEAAALDRLRAKTKPKGENHD